MGKYRYNLVRSIGNTHQQVLTRKVLERIEKKLDYFIKSTNQYYDPERI